MVHVNFSYTSNVNNPYRMKFIVNLVPLNTTTGLEDTVMTTKKDQGSHLLLTR